MVDVQINEKGPREGFQLEPGPIRTEQKISLVNALAETGLRSIQVAAFVDPKRVPGWADAEAVVAGIGDFPGVAFTAACLNARGVERAVATGRITLEGGLGTSASEPFLIRNQNQDFVRNRQDILKRIAIYTDMGIQRFNCGVMAAFGCNFAGEIPVGSVLQAIERMQEIAGEADLTIAQICLYDTMAWATPRSIQTVVGAVRDRWPANEILLHLHDTRGMAMANALAGLQLGVRHFDSSIGGLGGCPFAGHKGASGNISTEDLAFMCEEMGMNTGLDLDRLIAAALLAEEIVGHPLPGSIMHGGRLPKSRAAAAAA